jgi:hypothetical protein
MTAVAQTRKTNAAYYTGAMAGATLETYPKNIDITRESDVTLLSTVWCINNAPYALRKPIKSNCVCYYLVIDVPIDIFNKLVQLIVNELPLHPGQTKYCMTCYQNIYNNYKLVDADLKNVLFSNEVMRSMEKVSGVRFTSPFYKKLADLLDSIEKKIIGIKIVNNAVYTDVMAKYDEYVGNTTATTAATTTPVTMTTVSTPSDIHWQIDNMNASVSGLCSINGAPLQPIAYVESMTSIYCEMPDFTKKMQLIIKSIVNVDSKRLNDIKASFDPIRDILSVRTMTWAMIKKNLLTNSAKLTLADIENETPGYKIFVIRTIIFTCMNTSSPVLPYLHVYETKIIPLINNKSAVSQS